MHVSHALISAHIVHLEFVTGIPASYVVYFIILDSFHGVFLLFSIHHMVYFHYFGFNIWCISLFWIHLRNKLDFLSVHEIMNISFLMQSK